MRLDILLRLLAEQGRRMPEERVSFRKSAFALGCALAVFAGAASTEGSMAPSNLRYFPFDSMEETPVPKTAQVLQPPSTQIVECISGIRKFIFHS